MKKVKKGFYSLKSVGYRPKLMRSETLAFFYEHLSLSIFRYHLDNISINEKSLKEFYIRQNILIKQFIGLSKLTKSKPLDKTIKYLRQVQAEHDQRKRINRTVSTVMLNYLIKLMETLGNS
ncbi:hypothetical protein BpHYR1_016724 [Brachionus plicatilis]|uniref:Uncharacterized protein n=1 Tax=Brachionus plicatilis TaxID=10195 RepID=A0A3M7QKJ2_BRAPC|nr:hypothetical protein BpHYR1_016724 [Brachionus plicatilis]